MVYSSTVARKTIRVTSGGDGSVTKTRISKLSEVIGSSPLSFEDAVQQALQRANQSLAGIRILDVLGKRAVVEDGRIVSYEVRMNVIFELVPDLDMHE